MKTCIKNRLALSGLMAALGLVSVDDLTAQTFTTLATNVQPLIVSGNTIYGTADDGSGISPIVALNTDGTGLRTLYASTPTNGGAPSLVSGSALYGICWFGGVSGNGALFRLNTDGTGFTVLYTFADRNSDGYAPSQLILSGGTLYGTTLGGASGNGTVFAINTDGTGFTTLYSFSASDPTTGTNSDGAGPIGAPLTLSGSTLYGVTQQGGSGRFGTVFAVNTDGTGFATLHSFTGSAPQWAGLILSGITLYGTAYYGGGFGYGTVFALRTDGTGFTVLHTFSSRGFNYPGINSDGANPLYTLALSSNTLYGVTEYGGSSGFGTVFAVNTDGTGFTTLHSFNAPGQSIGPLFVSGNNLFGGHFNAKFPGTYTLFSLTLDSHSTSAPVILNVVGNGFAHQGQPWSFTAAVAEASTYQWSLNGTNLIDQTRIFGAQSNVLTFTNVLATDAGTYLLSVSNAFGVASTNVMLTVLPGGSLAQTLTTLHDFDGANDGNPSYTGFPNTDPESTPPGGSGLILSGSTLYGTAYGGGSGGSGTVFSMNTDGTGFQVLYSFSTNQFSPSEEASLNGDGADPYGLVLSGNKLYGTALAGGSGGGGTVFALNTDGTGFQVLHSFTVPYIDPSNVGGAYPAGLILSGNTLYGAAAHGGIGLGAGEGTVFALNTDGTGFQVLHTFSAYQPTTIVNSDGATPYGLALSGNTLYGATLNAGAAAGGTVFAMNIDGSGFRVLHAFGTSTPFSSTGPSELILSESTLYSLGSEVSALNTDGTGFRTLYGSVATRIGSGGMVLAGKTLYGTDYGGGRYGYGSVFNLSTDGTGFRPLYSFTYTSVTNADGAGPGGLILAGNTLYGVTATGGSLGYGTIFSLSLPPQLTLVPAGTNLVLTWPTNSSGYTLLSSTNLSPAATWTIVPQTPAVLNGQNAVTTPVSGTQQFFRLVQ